MQASRLPHRRTDFTRIARGTGMAMLDFAPANQPPVYFSASASGGTRNWSRVRMQVVPRHGCRCYRCGRLGDEITSAGTALLQPLPSCSHLCEPCPVTNSGRTIFPCWMRAV
jgi:hypothetical protein